MKGIDLITYNEPTSPMSEAYRTLRTNILYSSFDLKLKTVLVTSAGAGEGKTTTSANLAMVMAQSGNKTLLIDCDQRKPRIHKVFGLFNTNGLSDILVGKNGIEIGIQMTEVPNLHVLSSGTIPPNPAELLGSKKMQRFIEALKENYDFIILDTPPITMVTDAQILAQYADGCILVVASAEAQIEAVERAKNLLEKVNAKILGVVLNKLDVDAYGSKYYHYTYQYGETQKVKSKRRFKR